MERIRKKLVLILFGLLTMLGVQVNDIQRTYEDEENKDEHMFI